MASISTTSVEGEPRYLTPELAEKTLLDGSRVMREHADPELFERFAWLAFRPKEYTREYPVFGLPGISFRLPDGRRVFRWAKIFRFA